MSTRDLDELLAAQPLPPVGGDKGDRGSAVVVAGAPGCPGAAVLSAVAALRAGAGRVQVVTHPDLTTAIGLAVPEAFVAGWDLRGTPPDDVVDLLAAASAVLVGPGLDDAADGAAIAVAGHLAPETPLLVDALAMPAAATIEGRHLLVLPNLAEARDLAGLLDLDGDLDPLPLGRAIAGALAAPVAIRSEETVVVGDGEAWSAHGHPGLGTAGSGDVLVGVAVGLLARGLPDLQSIAWAVAAHATAGSLLGRSRPNPGYLARELLDAIPTAIDHLGSHRC